MFLGYDLPEITTPSSLAQEWDEFPETM